MHSRIKKTVHVQSHTSVSILSLCKVSVLMFLCSNKEVAKANYDLHEPHCKRFLCKCPDCNDTVPRDQLEEHKTEQHAQVTTTPLNTG